MAPIALDAAGVAGRYAANAPTATPPRAAERPEASARVERSERTEPAERTPRPPPPAAEDRVTLSAAAIAPASTRESGTVALQQVSESQRLRAEAALADEEAAARLASERARERSEAAAEAPAPDRTALAQAAREVDEAARTVVAESPEVDPADARRAAQAERGISDEAYAAGSAYARADAQRAEADRLDAEAGGGTVTRTSSVENFRGFGRGTLNESDSGEGRTSFSFSGGVRSDGTTLRVTGAGDAFDEGRPVAVETVRPAVSTARGRVLE